jgi:hypothetical protein
VDDVYLKTVFWMIVILYTLAIIGVWENFAKPIWGWAVIYLGPIIIANWQSIFS